MTRTTPLILTCIYGLLLAMPPVGAADAASHRIPFLLGVQNAQQLDTQVATLLSDYARIIALRIPIDSAQQSQDEQAAVQRIKHAAPHVPVLMYAWVSRDVPGTTGSKGIMDWVDADGRMQIQTSRGRAMRGYGDVRNPEYRAKTAASIAAAVEHRGYDGAAIDLAIRTPQYRPKPLTQLCGSDASFCPSYAQGMDETFAAVREALRGRDLIYNGIWNFGPGSVSDQMQLLSYTDAAIVEFFGGDPRTPENDFKHDVLPYLDVMPKIPAGKNVFVMGRGSWHYSTYAVDFARQRYLYCAYLLAAGPDSYFKYHSTFQVATPSGRSGGLDMYSDWLLDIGTPTGGYQEKDGLYSREFSKGMVVVAADDGNGGTYEITQPMYSPEGKQIAGKVSLHPAEGLLLFRSKPAESVRDDLLNLELLADWPNAKLHRDAKDEILTLQGGSASGSHDMLIDPIRSMNPRPVLQLQLRATDRASDLQIVAEVDEQAGQHEYAVVDLRTTGEKNDPDTTPALAFRASAAGTDQWPVVHAPPMKIDQWDTITLDGRTLFAKSPLTFRRWSYVRLTGPLDLKSVRLLN